jgi:hypothetical protein
VSEDRQDIEKALAQDQDEHGVDLAWLRYNLSLSIADRIEKHRKAAESVLYLRHVAKRSGYRSPR